jgi:ABC-2 type transport system ATP-binding protein
LKAIFPTRSGEATTDPDLAIDVRGMTKRFGHRTVVNGLDLQARRGEIFGFLGPNGSGKTTFIRMLCGLLRADGGSGTCLGLDVIRQSAAIKRQVGYMTQRFSFYDDLSVVENLLFVARMYGLPDKQRRIDACVEDLGLGDYRGQLAGQLSGGWKQRMALAACMLHDPKLLLLDEPTAGVDPKARRDFWERLHLLAAQGLTILITTHYMDEAERCHRLAYIASGYLLARGTVEDVIRAAGIVTWEAHCENATALAERLKGQPGVLQVVPFGNRLHVSGSDAAALEATIERFREPGCQWENIETSLEDAFIQLMDARHGEVGS